MRSVKRYVLFSSDVDLTEWRLAEMDAAFSGRGWKGKLIPVEGCPRAIIVKTTGEFAASMRGVVHIPGGLEIRSVLTSGAVGNLKRRARETAANGQVHE